MNAMGLLSNLMLLTDSWECELRFHEIPPEQRHSLLLTDPNFPWIASRTGWKPIILPILCIDSQTAIKGYIIMPYFTRNYWWLLKLAAAKFALEAA
jgi:hypothetical protein